MGREKSSFSPSTGKQNSFPGFTSRAMQLIFIWIIKFYQKIISPFFPQTCRFYPTCSAYAVNALQKYGTLKGLILSVKRILRCHPFNPGGYDPVP
ncbi:MAG: membrane protein insertion efficiency factor YidD [Spirochaetes bacterium]|nr:MAG: membrane protein insertion efficiency factor YidD [Spirochaetota bacterium]